MTFRFLATLALIVLVAVSASATPSGLPDAKAQKAAVKCQKTIDQADAKLFAGELKSLDACATAVLACIQTKPEDAKCLQKAGSKCSKAVVDAIAQARLAAAAKIVKSCGTPLRQADLLASDGLGIGARAADCDTDFGLNVCTDLPTLAQCLVDTSARDAARVFAAEQPRASELIQHVLSPSPVADLPPFPGCDDCAQAPSETAGKAVAACGAAVTKAGRTFAAAVGKGLGGCIDKVFACLQTKPGDAKCVGKAEAACDGVVQKLAGARQKLSTGITKKCGDPGGLPFATLASPSALNLNALADDCTALGLGPLGTLDDYVACVRRQHECRVGDLLRNALPRTAELLDAGLVGTAGALLDASQCPASLPSEALIAKHAARAPRVFGFSIARFFSMSKIANGGTVKATTVGASAPSSSPGAVRRIGFPLGLPGRFVPGTSRLVKVSWSSITKTAQPHLDAATAAAAPTMIVTVRRSDLEVEDHLEVPLDPVAAGADGTVDLQIDYDAAPPSCVFDVAFAIDDGGEVSDYTEVEQVSDTVPPPTATAVPAPTSTPGATVVPTRTSTAGPGSTATATPIGGTPTVTPSATSVTPTPTPVPAFAYALTTTDDTSAPGDTANLVLTVTNLSNAPQSATLTFTVPNFTTYGGFGAGAVRGISFTNVAAGTSQSALVPLVVTTGASAPPDGTVVTVTFNDSARGASVARQFTTDSAPAATLTLATAQASVAPGGAFTYALDFHNVGVGPLDSAELSVAVPAGATFVSAEDGVTPGVDGIVRWPLGAIAGSATGQRTVTFAASAAARGPLVVLAELGAGGQPLALASMATTVTATPVFAYTLTSIDDGVAPGATALFRLTATNLTNAAQDATLFLRVPDFTTFGGFGGGTLRSVTFSNVAAGASASTLLPFVLPRGASAPPDGTVIDLAVNDTARGAAVARAVVADATPAAKLALATADATVAAGGTFAYTLAFDNPGIAGLANTELSVRVPDGATFVAADGGVAPDPDGVVRWELGTLAGNASGLRTVRFAAAAATKTPLLVEAALRNALSGEVVTQASAATTLAANPALAYTLTSVDDAVGPGDTAVFRLTATNLTNAAQSATLFLRVPDFTTLGGFGGGTVRSVTFTNVAAGASQSVELAFVVTTNADAPPDGTVIALAVDDEARGANLSRTIVARSAPVVELTLTTDQGTIAPGGTFAYTLAFNNPRSTSLPFVELGVRVPAGATFVSADEGVVPDADGIVRWPIGTLAGNGGGERTITLTAGANAKTPMLVEADVHDGSTHEVLTRASAATAIYASAAFAYALTTTDDDPIVPGNTATFVLTATNLTNAPQSSTLFLRVPDFTTFGGFGGGTVRSVTFTNVAAGGSQSSILAFVVTSGAAAPPDGTVIGLTVDDIARAGAVSRSIVARAAGRAELKLSTPIGTTAPSGGFNYQIDFHNQQAAQILGAELSVPVPAGASFFSADGGGAVGTDGVVRWPLGTLAGAASGHRSVTFSANPARTAPLLVEATLADGNGDVAAHASAATPIYTQPTFLYSLTTASDTISAGQQASFMLVVSNLTNTVQNATIFFRVPDFTTFGGFGPGVVRSVTFSNVQPSSFASTNINLNVTSGAQAPPTGTLIDLTTTDTDRGASVSHTIVVN